MFHELQDFVVIVRCSNETDHHGYNYSECPDVILDSVQVKQLTDEVRRVTYVFANIVLVVSVAVEFSLLLSPHSVRLSQTVLQLFQLMIKTQDFRLLLTTLSFHAVTLDCQSVTHVVNTTLLH